MYVDSESTFLCSFSASGARRLTLEVRAQVIFELYFPWFACVYETVFLVHSLVLFLASTKHRGDERLNVSHLLITGRVTHVFISLELGFDTSLFEGFMGHLAVLELDNLIRITVADKSWCGSIGLVKNLFARSISGGS